jgi:hypothetical protein
MAEPNGNLTQDYALSWISRVGSMVSDHEDHQLHLFSLEQHCYIVTTYYIDGKSSFTLFERIAFTSISKCKPFQIDAFLKIHESPIN